MPLCRSAGSVARSSQNWSEVDDIIGSCALASDAFVDVQCRSRITVMPDVAASVVKLTRAVRYAVAATGAPLMPSQQSSFIGSRTALMPHDFQAVMIFASAGPLKMRPDSLTHSYSVPM